MGADEVQKLAAAAAARAHGEAQIGAVEAVDEHLRRRREQPFQDIGAGRGIGGRGECHRLRGAERAMERGEVHVFGAEIMAPLGNAMGLVDRQQADFRGLEHGDDFGIGEAFRRDVGEPQFAAPDLLDDGAILVEAVGRVERRRGDAVAAQLRHLVAHQCDQRRDHDGDPVAHQRRKLVAQRLAAAGRHDRQHVAAGEDGLDDLRLAVAERRKAEHAAKQVTGGGEIGHYLLPPLLREGPEWGTPARCLWVARTPPCPPRSRGGKGRAPSDRTAFFTGS